LRDFDRDRERDNLAVASGHVVQRFSAFHLRQEPESVIELIAAAGRHRAATG
jgi:very-short-patch-repair endonuclease